jgi:hypothetical protein
MHLIISLDVIASSGPAEKSGSIFRRDIKMDAAKFKKKLPHARKY